MTRDQRLSQSVARIIQEKACSPSCWVADAYVQATSLSKLRHPDLLHMIEPLEETRSELTFVTEPIVDSLNGVVQRIIGDSRNRRGEEELDEVEVGAFDER